MNRRDEHAGFTSRYEDQPQHTGQIMRGVGFNGRKGGGGVVRHIPPEEMVRINGRITHRPGVVPMDVENFPPVGLMAHLFDKHRFHIGFGEHRGFGEWYVENELAPDVEYYEPMP